MIRLVALGLSVLLLQACSSATTRPDLERLYRQAQPLKLPPVIMLHGIMGARLSDGRTGEEIWYGSIRKLAFSNFAELALEIDPKTLEPIASRLQPSGLTDTVAGKDFYGNIIKVLEQAGGYHAASAGHPGKPGQREYYIFTYDWRQDNVVTAGKLADLIDTIKQDHADPELNVDLIAHSMGGLVARYYLRYGREDVLDDNDFPINFSGARNVRHTVLLGTPNLGSVGSLHAFIEGSKVGFRSIPPETLATMPSIYQLFPHSLQNWLITAKGKSLDRDIFETEIWRRFQWSIFNPEVRQRVIDQAETEADGQAWLDMMERYFEKRLERARRFVWSLTVPLPDELYELIVFGGDCSLTPAKLLVEEIDGISEVRLWPREVRQPLAGMDYDMLMLEPGDGTVTKASLLARENLDTSIRRHRYIDFPLDYSLFLCEQHQYITGNVSFQDNLLHALINPDAREED